MKDRLARLSGAIQFALEAADLRKTNDLYLRELEESTARYRSLFEDSPISLWEEDFSQIKTQLDQLKTAGIKDLDAHFSGNREEILKLAQLRNIKAINAATLKLYEAENEEEALERLGNLFTDESLELYWDEIRHLYQGNTSYQINAKHFTLKGRLINVSLNVVIAPGYEDSWGKIFNSILDVTELTQAQLQIAESEALLRTVIDSSPDSIMVKDKNYTVLLANQAIADTINTTAEAMIGKTEDEIGYPLDWVFGNPEKGIKGFRETDDKVLHHGEETRDLFPFPVSNELHYFEVFKKPLRNPAGEITSELVYSRDITEIVKAQKELEQSEQLLRMVIDSSPDSILVKDTNQIFSLANQAAANDLGTTPEEMIGKTDMDLGYTKDQIFGNPAKGIIGFRELDEVVFQEGKDAHHVIPFMIDGKINYFDAIEKPLRDAEGKHHLSPGLQPQYYRDHSNTKRPGAIRGTPAFHF